MEIIFICVKNIVKPPQLMKKQSGEVDCLVLKKERKNRIFLFCFLYFYMCATVLC